MKNLLRSAPVSLFLASTSLIMMSNAQADINGWSKLVSSYLPGGQWKGSTRGLFPKDCLVDAQYYANNPGDVAYGLQLIDLNVAYSPGKFATRQSMSLEIGSLGSSSLEVETQSDNLLVINGKDPNGGDERLEISLDMNHKPIAVRMTNARAFVNESNGYLYGNKTTTCWIDSN